MQYIGLQREEEAELWVRQRLGIDGAPDFFRALSAVNEAGDFAFVVVLTNFSLRNVDINIAVDAKSVRPKAMISMYNEVFKYIFETLRIIRVTGLLRGRNIQAKRVTERFGFKLEGIMRSVFPDDDMHVYGLLAEDYHEHDWYRG